MNEIMTKLAGASNPLCSSVSHVKTEEANCIPGDPHAEWTRAMGNQQKPGQSPHQQANNKKLLAFAEIEAPWN